MEENILKSGTPLLTRFDDGEGYSVDHQAYIVKKETAQSYRIVTVDGSGNPGKVLVIDADSANKEAAAARNKGMEAVSWQKTWEMVKDVRQKERQQAHANKMNLVRGRGDTCKTRGR